MSNLAYDSRAETAMTARQKMPPPCRRCGRCRASRSRRSARPKASPSRSSAPATTAAWPRPISRSIWAAWRRRSSSTRSAPTPNLIILESRREPRELLESLAQLAEYCDPTTKVVVIGHYNDVGLYRELIRSGISEYVVAPISMADIVSVISAIFVDPDAEPIGRSIAFIGAKGGVGSSTIAHNVAWAMSTLFKSEVVVADLDLAFGTANINFDQDPAQGIAEAVFSPERIDEVYLDRLLAQCSEHLSLLAAPSTLERVYDFDPDAFSQIIDTAQRSAPLLVLDVPHVWNGWTKTTLMQADEVVITATPELANLRNTKNLVDMLKRLRPNDAPPKLDHQPGRHAEAARDHPRRTSPSRSAFRRWRSSRSSRSCSATPPTTGACSARWMRRHAIVQTINEIAHVLTGRSEIKTKKKAGPGQPARQAEARRRSDSRGWRVVIDHVR